MYTKETVYIKSESVQYDTSYVKKEYIYYIYRSYHLHQIYLEAAILRHYATLR